MTTSPNANRDNLFGWRLRTTQNYDHCDGCAEQKPCPYEWPATEAWLCEECWTVSTEVERLRALVADLVDEDECHYDHHGYCQAHSLHERPCPHERARTILDG